MTWLVFLSLHLFHIEASLFRFLVLLCCVSLLLCLVCFLVDDASFPGAFVLRGCFFLPVSFQCLVMLLCSFFNSSSSLHFFLHLPLLVLHFPLLLVHYILQARLSKFYFDNDVDWDEENDCLTWICPSCGGCCSCATCRKKYEKGKAK